MKTLILLLAASLSAPAFAQNSYDTNNSTMSSEDRSSTYGSDTSSPMSGSSSYNDDSTSSSFSNKATGSSTDTYSESYPQGSGSMSDRTTGSSTTMSPTTSAPATTAPSMTAPSATAPSATAPAASQPSALTSNEAATSRAYHEDMGAQRKAGGLYLEPAIFGSREDADIKGNIVGADTTGNANGFGVDLKLGGHIGEMFFLAADGRYERSRFADTSYGDKDSNVWNWGPTVGLQAPWAGMRVYGTYVVDGTYDPESNNAGTDLAFKDPYGWRGGIGFRLSTVSLNFEYEDLTYRTTTIQSLGGASLANRNTPVDFAQRGYLVSLSFPIEL